MENYYYITASGRQVGPMNLQTLRQQGIAPTTLVWRPGMADWADASTLPELSDMFGSHNVPPYTPPQPQYQPQYNYYGQGTDTQRPASYLWLGILTTLFCCLPAGIVSIVFAAKVDGAWASGDYATAKANSDKARNWGIISAVVGAIAQAILISTGYYEQF